MDHDSQKSQRVYLMASVMAKIIQKNNLRPKDMLSLTGSAHKAEISVNKSRDTTGKHWPVFSERKTCNIIIIKEIYSLKYIQLLIKYN